MGRKIPAKKHRGVKDPLEQQARRLQSIKSKINAPPKDPDEQPVPRSLTRLFAFQEKVKGVEKPINKKKNNKQSRIVGKDNVSGGGDNPISRLRKLPGESGRGFSLRINSAIKALHDPIQHQDYPQDMDTEDYKGERMAMQRERRARKHRKAHAASGEPHLTRTQKLAQKKKDKKMKSEELTNLERREVVYERVAFGEVTHAPPTLALHNKKLAATAAAGAPRPGRRSLLLTSMLSAPAAGGGGGGGGAGDAAAGADLLRRERARLDAIAAYRTLKASKHKHKS